MPESQLISELDNELHALHQRLGEERFPKRPKAYLDDWSHPERGWLRRSHPVRVEADEPHYDVTPAVETALKWVESLQTQAFVGTESRLTIIVDLLRQLIYGAGDDPTERLEDLHRRRDEIDAAIETITAGGYQPDDPVTQRDRYQQFARTARDLLSDFRQVEDNFRHLDRDLRIKIAGWEGSKGELLDEVVASRSSIAESDQGKSFRAFYDLLLTSERHDELSDLLGRLHTLDGIPELDVRLERSQHDWLEASARTQATVRQLSEQLRRFLDDQVWLENRRIIEVLRSIESSALTLRDDPHITIEAELDATKVDVRLAMERPLYRKVRTTKLDNATIELGEGVADPDVLHTAPFIDTILLTQRVLASLGAGQHTTLDDVVSSSPLEEGLAELITYLTLGDEDLTVDISEQERSRIGWDDEQHSRIADLPQVTFERNQGEIP